MARPVSCTVRRRLDLGFNTAAGCRFVLTRWWMMQSGANQSLKGYSLLCGKEQGISRLLRTSDLTKRQQTREITLVFQKIP